MNGQTARQLALLGAVLVMLGLLTGFATILLADPRMGLSSHLEGLMNGMLLLALSSVWHRVSLPQGQERAALWLLAFGTVANWAATLLAAIWGAGAASMPIAASHTGTAWQEQLIMVLLLTLSFAMIGGVGLVVKGLLAGRGTD